MSSNIQWTEETWNPVAGCSLVSPGCTNCYAMKMAARLEAMGQQKYVGLTHKVNGKSVWTGKLSMDEKALSIPLKRKKPTMYFVNSMSDLFHEDVPFAFIEKVFDVMWQTEHVYQILTKRPAHMAETVARLLYPALSDKMLENIWLGTSVEDQRRLTRIDDLRECRAVIRFLSLEPLLEDLGQINLEGIHWVIVGGESGLDSRECNLAWIKRIVDQCRAARVPCFVKQVGAHPVNTEPSLRCGMIRDKKGGAIEEWPEALQIREFPESSREANQDAVTREQP